MKVNYSCSFMEDLCAINDNRLFEKYFKELHPEELQLKREKTPKKEATFLDINLEITKLLDRLSKQGNQNRDTIFSYIKYFASILRFSVNLQQS